MVSLAKMLQIPIAVAENKVGNRSALARKTRLKELEVPILLNRMNSGIQNVKE